jgi:hypothetical protein
MDRSPDGADQTEPPDSPDALGVVIRGVLAACRARGVTFEVRGDRLVAAPGSRLTDAEQTFLREHRETVKALLGVERQRQGESRVTEPAACDPEPARDDAPLVTAPVASVARIERPEPQHAVTAAVATACGVANGKARRGFYVPHVGKCTPITPSEWAELGLYRVARGGGTLDPWSVTEDIVVTHTLGDQFAQDILAGRVSKEQSRRIVRDRDRQLHALRHGRSGR